METDRLAERFLFWVTDTPASLLCFRISTSAELRVQCVSQLSLSFIKLLRNHSVLRLLLSFKNK